jgi:hypothetical protein
MNTKSVNCPAIFWIFWTTYLFSALRFIFVYDWMHVKCCNIVRYILKTLFGSVWLVKLSLGKFLLQQLNLEFDIVTGTDAGTEASKRFYWSTIDSNGVKDNACFDWKMSQDLFIGITIPPMKRWRFFHVHTHSPCKWLSLSFVPSSMLAAPHANRGQ